MVSVALPYRTDWATMLTLLDYAKGKGVDRSTLEARLGAGETLRETLNATEQLGLVSRDERGEIRLTDAGQRLAYAASDSERRSELQEALIAYWPYQVPLERALRQSMTVLDSYNVERIWQVDLALNQPRNRVEEARTFFFRLCDEAGFGIFRRGARGQPTRLELTNDFEALVARLIPDDMTTRQSEGQPEELESDPSGSAIQSLLSVQSHQSAARREMSLPTAGSGATSFSITVDMSEWDLAKIEAFLRMVGVLDEAARTTDSETSYDG